ncbi:MAG: transporter, MMPL family [uncultured Thermoleophilia bacterium]|uniref:Transporter, MMPL family n=1 Tax=uncultured Thermoleophilia bacterium TaxID=1497501 RepID=A0A6J4TX35_9ACTN|nr:MAG: transporter, MMPL family [uncultured Thermoleophilia bacterium]
MSNLLTFPASRSRKWIVALMWLVVIAGGASFGAKFEGAQSNESSSFLPGGTESLEALELADRFPSGEQVPAVIVFRREAGLTEADRRAVAAEVEQLRAELPPVAEAPTPPQLSPDGRAALVTVPMEVGGDSEALIDAVDQLRATLAGTPEGLDVKLGGPAGFSADAISVFGDINGTLLLSTSVLVFVLLLLIYRSPVFWLIPLICVAFAELTVRAIGYGLTQAGVTVNGQTGGILLVLVFGAGTDYALLLVARYREELHRHENRHDAMRVALRQAGPAIVASAGTVVAGLLCLALAEVNGTAGLGVVGAMGVAVAAVAMLTILPALLLIVGRWVFWPFVPRADGGRTDLATRGVFRRVGERIARAPRPVWAGTTAALLLMVGGLAFLNFGLTSANGFRADVEAVAAQELIGRSFPAGTNAPTNVIVLDPTRTDQVRSAVEGSAGVAALGEVEAGDGLARFPVTLEPEPYSGAAYDLIPDLRDAIAATAGEGAALVGGPTAEERDLRVASARDSVLLPPIVLTVIFLILVVLLRSLVAPLLLIGSVILSYAATLGVCAFLFDTAFGFPGVEPGFPLFAFIFLVAFGVDYNIFLMARVREETLRHGTREGMLRGLGATGSVITSAGIVLAGTFAVLGVLPLVALTEIGFAIAFGVLLDTLIVRSLLVPALVFDLDRRIWWPSRLARADGAADAPHAAVAASAAGPVA